MVQVGLLNWHKRFTENTQEKLKISNYQMVWFASLEGLVWGLIVGIVICKLL